MDHSAPPASGQLRRRLASAPGRQSGVALVTALLVVALGSMLAVSMFEHLQIQIQRSQNLFAMAQGFEYSRGLEAWAIVALQDDLSETGAVDSRQEPWAQGLPAIPLENGYLSGQMSDLDGRFNLNNLFVDGSRPTQEVERFRRLLKALRLDPALAEAVVDWLDPDTFAGPGGAEDSEYQRLNPPYRSANRSFVHPSELRLVLGFEPRIFAKLAPHIATLPVADGPTPVNVNTATPAVLMSLHDNITLEIAERLYQEGRAQHASVSEFMQQQQLQEIQFLELDPGLSVDSHYFLAHGVISVNETIQHFYSIIEQGRGGFAVIYRSRGAY